MATTRIKTEDTKEEAIKLPEHLQEKLYEATGRIKPDPGDFENYEYNPTIFERQLDDLILENKATEAKAVKATTVGAGVEGELTEAVFRGGKAGAIIQFDEDPDKEGPLTTDTYWHVDPTTKKIIPILSEEAFEEAFGIPISDWLSKNKVNIVSLNATNTGQMFEGYSIAGDIEGIGSEKGPAMAETTIDAGKISTRYGKPQDQELHRKVFRTIEGFFKLIKADPDSGLSPTFIDEISNNSDIVGFFVNAFAYGNYNLNDIFRDMKRRSLVKEGRSDLNEIKVIDEELTEAQYYNTPEGKTIRTNPDLSVPSYIGDVDTGLLNNSVFDLPDEIYQTLVPVFDWSSEEGQTRIESIQSAYHDVLLQQVQATTEKDKAVADYNYSLFQKALERNFGIILGDNAFEAWGQIGKLGTEFVGRGLTGTGLHREARERYLRGVRKADERLREEKLTKEEAAERSYYLTSASVEEMAQLDEATKIKWGLKPDDETAQWFSKENLRKLYPNLSEREIDIYSGSIIDPQGNYRSQIYQNLQAKKIGIEEEKRTLQMGDVSYDQATGRVTGGSGAIYEKALEEEKAYKEVELAKPFEKPLATEVGAPEVAVPEVEVPEAWKAPEGYERISEPSRIPEYSDTIKDPSPGAVDIWGKKKPATDVSAAIVSAPEWTAPKSTVLDTPFQEFTKGKTDILGKQWKGYTSIKAEEYKTPKQKKLWQNVQSVGGTLYGFK